MGYTTKFTGAISLSRKLTFAEAKEILEANEDSDVTEHLFGMKHYLQWVPTESLDAIVWDGQEKFYEYAKLLEALCNWLVMRGVESSGELLWAGESADDRGTITVVDSVVSVVSGKAAKAKSGRPLTLSKLAEMALEQVTAA